MPKDIYTINLDGINLLFSMILINWFIITVLLRSTYMYIFLIWNKICSKKDGYIYIIYLNPKNNMNHLLYFYNIHTYTHARAPVCACVHAIDYKTIYIFFPRCFYIFLSQCTHILMNTFFFYISGNSFTKSYIAPMCLKNWGISPLFYWFLFNYWKQWWYQNERTVWISEWNHFQLDS